MKSSRFLQTTRHALRDSLFCLGLTVLAFQMPMAATGQSIYSTPYTFTTLAGNPGYGSTDGTGNTAQFYDPADAAVDRAGNVYVADRNNQTIRKMTPVGTNWVVTTLAGLAGSSGSSDGTNSAARFYAPSGVAADSAANLYVADYNNSTIRKVTPAGVVTTLAGLAGIYGTNDGTGTNARFYGTGSLALGTNGIIYVTDTYNDTIRKITPVGTNWVVSTLAGLGTNSGTNDGTGSAARFNLPYGVAVDTNGNLYVADNANNTIRKVTAAGMVTTLAGLAGSPGTNDGMGTNARFDGPVGVTMDGAGNFIIADQVNSTIRKMTPAGMVTTLAGLGGISGTNDGTGNAARFYYPAGTAVNSNGSFYVADDGNNTIRLLTPAGVVTTLAGLAVGSGTNDGTGRAAQFYGPAGLALNGAGNFYVSDSGNNTIRKMTASGVVTTLAGLPQFDTNGNSVGGSADGTNGAARFNYPAGIAVDGAGNLYVADLTNSTIRKLTPVGTNWVVTTLAGLAGNPGTNDGTNSAARFTNPLGVAVDSASNVYVGDAGNNTIRKMTPSGTNWVVTTLAGLGGISGTNDGTNGTALFNNPAGVALDASSNVYVADFFNFTIRKMTRSGTNWVVTTLAGHPGINGTNDGTNGAAQFAYPWGVAVDNAGNVYVTDGGNNTIRKMTPSGMNWAVTTLAGLPQFDQDDNPVGGSADGTGSAARFNYPQGVTVDTNGNVYVADFNNSTIRKGFAASSVPPPMLHSASLSDGQFGFGMTGMTNLAVEVQSSGDFSHWQEVGYYILVGGSNYFVNPTPLQGNQFFRGHVQ